MPALNALFEKYRDRVAFFTVYIQEAHPSDGWQVSSNVRDAVLVADPRDIGERTGIAGTCVAKLGLEIPAVVDGMDNAVDRAYEAWPDRLYLIDSDGRVAFKSGPGPFGFCVDEAEKALEVRLAHVR